MNRPINDLRVPEAPELLALSQLQAIAPPEFLERLVLERATAELRAGRPQGVESTNLARSREPRRLPALESLAYATGIGFWVVEVTQAFLRLVMRS